jgi:hypothetical protein
LGWFGSICQIQEIAYRVWTIRRKLYLMNTHVVTSVVDQSADTSDKVRCKM